MRSSLDGQRAEQDAQERSAQSVLTYAVMSNHIHVILRNRPDGVSQWSDEEVAIRWLKVFPGRRFPGRRIEEHLAEPTENDVQTLVRNKEKLAEVRTRLSDISWLMRSLAESMQVDAEKHGRRWHRGQRSAAACFAS